MRKEIKRIRELENSLRSNNNPDFLEEYIYLHQKTGRKLPKDFLPEDPFDNSKTTLFLKGDA